MKSDDKMDHSAHGNADGSFGYGRHFQHTTATEGGIYAEFQVMSLASMNMTCGQGRDPSHVCSTSRRPTAVRPSNDAVGKIKVIAPDKSEQTSPLKNYNGILAANFTFKASGKYGVICLLKIQDKKQVFKVWYEHMQ